jgi:hypothetical protein
MLHLQKRWWNLCRFPSEEQNNLTFSKLLALSPPAIVASGRRTLPLDGATVASDLVHMGVTPDQPLRINKKRRTWGDWQ